MLNLFLIIGIIAIVVGGLKYLLGWGDKREEKGENSANKALINKLHQMIDSGEQTLSDKSKERDMAEKEKEKERNLLFERERAEGNVPEINPRDLRGN